MSKQRSRKHGQEAGTGTHDAGPDATPGAGDPGAEPQGAGVVGGAGGDRGGQDGKSGGAEPQELTDESEDQGAAPLPEGDGLDAGGDGGLAQQPDLPAGPAAPGEADQVADPVAGTGTDPAVSEVSASEERADDVDQAETAQSFTPRELAMIAAFNAGGATRAAVQDPRVFEGIFGRLPGGDRVVELFAILDESPDLPAEAIVKFLDKPDMPIEAAEAFKACYVGMAAWVKAENVRLTAPPASTRPSRYEKHGREERVGAKIVDQAEKDRIARNQSGLAIGDVSEEA